VRPVAVVGNVVLDVTVDVHLAAVPAGRQTPAPIGFLPGGGLPNVCARLEETGTPVLALGAIGDDPPGRLLRDLLPWDVASVPGAATEVSVIATRGDRAILNAQGTATLPVSEAAPRLRVAGVALFAYLNCCSLATADVPAAVAAADRAGCTVVGALNGVFSAERRRAVLDVLDRLDLLVLNVVEAAWLTGAPTPDAAAGRLAGLARRACLTLGPDGLLLLDGVRERRWATEPIPDGRSLGAGDALLAGLAAALADGAGWDAACERGLSTARAWVAGGAPPP
jgi:ribokinase